MDAYNIQFTEIEIKIVIFLFKHYQKKYNPRQLAKELDINHAHATKLCNLLTEKKLLIKERIGNSVYFSYDYQDALALKFMDYLLSLEEKEFPSKLAVLLHSLNKLKPHIQLGLVFGSSFKTKDFQDIDVFLLYDKNKSKIIKKTKDDIRKSELVEKPIRYIDITEKDILANKDDPIFYSILSDNMLFHGSEKYVEVIKKCRK